MGAWLIHQFGYAEVQKLHSTISGKENVRRLEVLVHDTHLVDILHTEGRLIEYVYGLLDR